MVNYADIDQPVTAEQPCGPDPDLDREIQNFLPVAEGQLPASYRDFNRKAFEAAPTLQALADLSRPLPRHQVPGAGRQVSHSF